MTEQNKKLGRCMAEDYEIFAKGARSEHRQMTRCRAAAVINVASDVFGNTDVCLCEKHLAQYDELRAVRIFRTELNYQIYEHRHWVMKLVIAEPRYIRRYGEVEVIDPNERSQHNRRHWLEASTDELSLWEEMLREREAALEAHREHEQELFSALVKTAQKVSDMRNVKKEVL